MIAEALDVPPAWTFIAYLCVGFPREDHLIPELRASRLAIPRAASGSAPIGAPPIAATGAALGNSIAATMSFHYSHNAFLNLSPFVRNARMNALGFFSKASTKFFHEVAPVALASVIGPILVNHYTHATAPSPVVVQPAPPRPDDAIVQTLHEEHQLIVDYLRRDAEAKEAVSDEGSAARRAPASVAAKDGLAKPRFAQEKVTRRARPKLERAQEPLQLGSDLASLPAPEFALARSGFDRRRLEHGERHGRGCRRGLAISGAGPAEPLARRSAGRRVAVRVGGRCPVARRDCRAALISVARRPDDLHPALGG